MNSTIIVGGGVAGFTMAYTLLHRGHKVTIIRNSSLPSASAVAAGLYNPVVFKRIVPTWLANDVVPYCKQFYTDVEQVTNSKFHYNIPILKLFTEQQEVDLWLKKMNDATTSQWLGSVSNATIEGVHNKHAGHATVNQSGWVNVPTLLQAYTVYFNAHKNCTLINEQFDYNTFSTTPTSVNYKGIQAQRIVFAEGVYVQHNPLFNHIIMKPTKGDVFKITANLSTDYVLNKGCFFIPYAPQQFIVGSTYNWYDDTWEPTAEGNAELLKKAKEVLIDDVVINEHTAGIRPTTHDRRPVLGKHYEYNNVYIFNGLGTKGVLLAPYLANHLAQYIHNEVELLNEVNVQRYNK
jgi:glycine oxidase